ncbi:MAG: hypothetical protein LBF15_03520 [Candidatus Peribacteria bacterium]|jgi:hypothetical protein|nr:hypothetical protein [Candidatus Peribacteria bacterium]
MPEGLKQGSINTSQESTNKRDKILQEFNFGEARNKSLEALKIRRRELINQTTIESKEERNSLREEI